MNIVYVPTNKILPSPFNSRNKGTDSTLSLLASSISHIGIVQPLILRSVYSFYEIVSGTRRLEAAKLLGIKEVPAIIIKADTPESIQLSLADNIQRRNLTFFEEADSFQTLMSYYGYDKKQISCAIGSNESYITKRLSLLSLDKTEKNILSEKNISLESAINISKLDKDTRSRVVETISAESTEDPVKNIILQKGLEKTVSEFPIEKNIKTFSEFLRNSVNKMRNCGFETSFIVMKGQNSCNINIKVSV